MDLGVRIKEQAVRQPRGLLGRLGGRMMAMDRDLPEWVLGLLEISPSDSVLEVGSGPGVGVELAAERAHEGWIVGVDPSEVMLDRARRRNSEALRADRVQFHRGTADDLPFDDAIFDAAMTINSLHLWSDPVAGLLEVRHTMRPGSRIAVAISRFSDTPADEIERQLADAGFEDVSEHPGDSGTCFLARCSIAWRRSSARFDATGTLREPPTHRATRDAPTVGRRRSLP